jgi:hypothetical protein
MPDVQPATVESPASPLAAAVPSDAANGTSRVCGRDYEVEPRDYCNSPVMKVDMSALRFPLPQLWHHCGLHQIHSSKEATASNPRATEMITVIDLALLAETSRQHRPLRREEISLQPYHWRRGLDQTATLTSTETYLASRRSCSSLHAHQSIEGFVARSRRLMSCIIGQSQLARQPKANAGHRGGYYAEVLYIYLYAPHNRIITLAHLISTKRRSILYSHTSHVDERPSTRVDGTSHLISGAFRNTQHGTAIRQFETPHQSIRMRIVQPTVRNREVFVLLSSAQV